MGVVVTVTAFKKMPACMKRTRRSRRRWRGKHTRVIAQEAVQLEHGVVRFAEPFLVAPDDVVWVQTRWDGPKLPQIRIRDETF